MNDVRDHTYVQYLSNLRYLHLTTLDSNPYPARLTHVHPFPGQIWGKIFRNATLCGVSVLLGRGMEPILISRSICAVGITTSSPKSYICFT